MHENPDLDAPLTDLRGAFATEIAALVRKHKNAGRAQMVTTTGQSVLFTGMWGDRVGAIDIAAPDGHRVRRADGWKTGKTEEVAALDGQACRRAAPRPGHSRPPRLARLAGRGLNLRSPGRATPPGSPRGRRPTPMSVTRWCVSTHSGRTMTTLWPDRSYAPVNVYDNGWLVRVKYRVRTGHCRACLGAGCGRPGVEPSYDSPYSRVPQELIARGRMLMPGWQADPAEPVGVPAAYAPAPQPTSV